MDYRYKIEELFKEQIENDGCLNKFEFLGRHVFDFTTYDSAIDEIMARKMIDVIVCISNGTTYDYIEVSHENYLNYIMMVNMPFLKNMLEWGISVRGAWFDYSQRNDNDFYYITNDYTIPKSDICSFMSDLIKWVSE